MGTGRTLPTLTPQRIIQENKDRNPVLADLLEEQGRDPQRIIQENKDRNLNPSNQF